MKYFNNEEKEINSVDEMTAEMKKNLSNGKGRD